MFCDNLNKKLKLASRARQEADRVASYSTLPAPAACDKLSRN
jgi:hypothetical protein